MDQRLKMQYLSSQTTATSKQLLLEKVGQKVYANFAWSCLAGQKLCC